MIKDKLFLLSITEVDKYLPDEKSRICMYEGVPCWWWLRSPGDDNTYGAANVYCGGCLYRDGYGVSNYYDAVRPALHLNLDYLHSLNRTTEGYVLFGGREWLILDEETGLLLAKDALCIHRFDVNSNNYEYSEIRSYLNNEVIHNMFTDDEQKMIVDTFIDGELSYINEIDDEFDMTEEQLIEKYASSQEKDALLKDLKRASVRASLMESLSKRKNNPPAKVIPFNPKESD